MIASPSLNSTSRHLFTRADFKWRFESPQGTTERHGGAAKETIRAAWRKYSAWPINISP